MSKQAFRLRSLAIVIALSLLTNTSFGTVVSLRAAENNTIDARVKISVCGNGIVEGGEDCELPSDSETTCGSGGITAARTCDISCSYYYEQCPVVELQTSQVSPSRESQPDSVSPPPAPTPEPPSATPVENPILMPKLSVYDPNNDKKLIKEELPLIVRLWVDHWKQSRSQDVQASGVIPACDMNEDRHCDVHDLSILLYYIDR